MILNGAYRVPVAATAVDRRDEIVAAEVHVVRVVLTVGRGRPIVAVEAHIVEIRAFAPARRRQEDCTSCLHLRPLCESVAVICPVNIDVSIISGVS